MVVGLISIIIHVYNAYISTSFLHCSNISDWGHQPKLIQRVVKIKLHSRVCCPNIEELELEIML